MAFAEIAEAGEFTLTPAFAWDDRRNLARRERRVLFDADTSLGRAVLTVVGYPSELTWWLDDVPRAGLVATHHAVDAGLVPIKYGEAPITLGDWQGALSLVAEGSRARLAGRRRYLRVAGEGHTWTYHHGGADGRDGADGVKRITGDPFGLRHLQRGEHPTTGQPVVSIRNDSKVGAIKEETFHVSWEAGAYVEEVALACMLLLGVDENELAPFLVRAAYFFSGTS